MASLNDKRFEHIAKDLRFRQLQRQKRKVKIDKRFKDMFDSSQFKLTYLVDKRGRPMCNTSSENLRRYYDASDSEKEEHSEENVINNDGAAKEFQTEKSVPSREKKQKLKNKKADMTEDAEKIDPKVKKKEKESKMKLKKVRQVTSENEDDSEDETATDPSNRAVPINNEDDIDGTMPDFARGKVVVDTSSDESAFEYEEEELDHQWGELDKDAPDADEITSRLALCNMDWERIKARDIMLILHSYVPPGGIIKSVKIYPSEYGLQRMEEEARLGPRELTDPGDEKNLKEDKEGCKYSQERLRRYELQKLKYYFAVAECDTPQTANHIYEQCDGIEYESSSNRLDLRFVPDDMTFDQQPTQTASELPTSESYKASFFFNSALQQSKVNLTWDETDPDRMAKLMKKFDAKEVDELDVRDYLASGSDEDNLPIAADGDTSDEDLEDEAAQIAKYRSLMMELNKGDGDKSGAEDCDMEITWEPELRDTVETMVKEKQKKETLTPWEQYLDKAKERKKKKRHERKAMLLAGEENDEMSRDEDSDSGEEIEKPIKKKRKHKKNLPVADDDTNEAELSLMLAEEVDERQHFNLKKLLIEKNAGKETNKKRKLKAEKQKLELEKDHFKIDVDDSRFNALFENPNFNIEPSAPEFKKTKAMDELLQEKIRKRHSREDENKVQKIRSSESCIPPVMASRVEVDPIDNSSKTVKNRIESESSQLSQLIQSVKAKAGHLIEHKNKLKKSNIVQRT